MQVIAAIFPFTMARSFLTFLRASRLSMILPINKQLDVHKELGYHLLLWSTIHTGAHLFNAARFSNPDRHIDSELPVKAQKEIYCEEVQVTEHTAGNRATAWHPRVVLFCLACI